VGHVTYRPTGLQSVDVTSRLGVTAGLMGQNLHSLIPLIPDTRCGHRNADSAHDIKHCTCVPLVTKSQNLPAMLLRTVPRRMPPSALAHLSAIIARPLPSRVPALVVAQAFSRRWNTPAPSLNATKPLMSRRSDRELPGAYGLFLSYLTLAPPN